MMKAQHKLDGVFCPLKHSQTHQRSFGKVKALFPNRTEVSQQMLVLLAGR
jgi:hypothetical protein